MKKFKETQKRKKVFITLVIFTVLLITSIIFYKTYAYYKIDNKYDVIKGIVPNFNYKDLSLAVVLDGENSKSFPQKSSNYIYEKMECNQNVNAYFDSQKWLLNIDNIVNPTKCTIFFKTSTKLNLKEAILNQEGGTEQIIQKGNPNFTTYANGDEGLFMSLDDYGESYYYRGDVKDNYVSFAGYYWRIIRINGNGSIRMIFQGKNPTSLESDSLIGQSNWQSNNYHNVYAGYMFGNVTASTYQETHQNTYDSSIKLVIDNWYENNLINYSSYLEDSLFCNDRSVNPSPISGDTGLGYGNNVTYYMGYYRLGLNSTPSLNCSQKNDRFTVSDTTIGNGALTYPVALITADEMVFAGNVFFEINNEIKPNYLKNNAWYYTMTPAALWDKQILDMFDLRAYGDIYVYDMNGKIGIRPVINLKADTNCVGNGTIENPFIIL